MRACIILKKDLEKLGKKLMKEFYERVHEEYFLEQFDEFKLQRKYYDKNMTKEFLSFYEGEEKKFSNLYFGNKKYKDLLEMETEVLLEKINDKIKNETLNYKLIYDFLSTMDDKLKINKCDEFEIDEDLFCMKKAFIKMFEIYHYDYYNLED